MKTQVASVLLVTLLAVASFADDQCQCGIERVQDKIINGRTAQPYRYPWMVFITMKMAGGSAACGGTIINDRFVLTAAHCVNQSQASGVAVYPMIHQKPGFFKLIFGIGSVSVKKIHIHSGYGENPMMDIALLEMASTFKFTKDFGPVCLPSFSELNEHSDLTAIGWGIVNPVIRLSPSKLREADLSLIPFDACNQTLGLGAQISGFALDENLIICAGGQQGICSGDSGGPLFTHKEGRAYQMGITSFALADCGWLTGAPAAFTRVSTHIKWIEQVTKSAGAKWCTASSQGIN